MTLLSRFKAVVFRCKTSLLSAKRAVVDFRDRPTGGAQTSTLDDDVVIGRSRSPLWTTTDPRELALTAGKVENLRVAIRSIHGREVEAGEVWSFWKALGRPSRRKGYVLGREIREGCIIPAIAGGICQLSNGLHEAALDAGLMIVERHAHTRVVPGSVAERTGRDATVFFRHVDLRFSSDGRFRIEARLTDSELIVEIRARAPKTVVPPMTNGAHSEASTQASSGGSHGVGLPLLASSARASSCETCDAECHWADHRRPRCFSVLEGSPTSYLLDAWWPEHEAWIRANVREGDVAFVPMAMTRAYRRWPLDRFAHVHQSPIVTLRRSIVSRRLARQGAVRQWALLASDRQLARDYARRLPFHAQHLVISQNLVVPLFEMGVLGGRSFDVLATRLPMDAIQRQLDEALSLYPASSTLGDYRVDAKALALERRALAAADRIVTPHAELAGLFPRQAVLVPWYVPTVSAGRPARAHPGDRARSHRRVVLFPGPTAGRRGAYEMRDLARRLDLAVRIVGANVESPTFWTGIDTQIVPRDANREDIFDGIDAVVSPAWVESAPRFVIEAIARDVPVLASSACGLGALSQNENVVVIGAQGAHEALTELLERAAVGVHAPTLGSHIARIARDD
ncbi:MAG TPA: VanW family protein [Labilithrix sp.]|nr:VanW family protein [Labilithrix sp.]